MFRWPAAKAEARMTSPLHEAVEGYIATMGGGQGLFPTAIETFNIVRSFEERMPMRQVYRPSLCIVLDGAKEILFGEDRLDYAAMEYLVVSVELPATGRVVTASADRPFVGLTLDIDVMMLREVMEQMEQGQMAPVTPGPCAFVGKVDAPLADCLLRLVRMLETPKAIPVLFPSVMRDISYWLASGPHGAELCKLTLPGSSIERVAKAITLLHKNFAQTLRVDELAEAASMSQSSFHQHFKALTSMSPLQFQKQLRLLEARRLMVAEAANVSDAAYQVGYESPSQFSREYSRTFGMAPKQDALNLQRLYREYGSRKVQAM